MASALIFGSQFRCNYNYEWGFTVQLNTNEDREKPGNGTRGGLLASGFGEIEARRFVEFHLGALEVLAVEGEEGALGDEGGGGVDVVGDTDVGQVLAEGEGLGGNGGGVGQS